MERLFIIFVITLTAAQVVSPKIYNDEMDYGFGYSYGRGQKQQVTWGQSDGGYEYTSFIYGPGCKSAERMRFPQSHEDVVAIVKDALQRGVNVKAMGARHSSTDIICTDGIPVDMHGIHEMILDGDNVVTSGAGATVGELTEYLASKGRGFPIIPAFQNITVGGAIGTGAHGSSIRYKAALSDQAIEVLIVDGLGNIHVIQSEQDLMSFRVHLGLLGIILQVKFRTIPLFKFRAHNYVMDDTVLRDKAIYMAESTDEILYHWYPSFQKVVVANWTRIEDVNVPGNAHTNALIPSTSRSFNFVGRRALEVAQSLKSLPFMNLLQYISFLALFKTVPDVQPIYTEDDLLVKNPAIGYYHRMSSVSCRDDGWVQCPWSHGQDGARALDNEMAIDLKDLPRFVKRVKDILQRSPAVFPFEGILVRFSGPSTSHLSLSTGRKTCHVEFYSLYRERRYEDAMVGLAAYQAIMQSLLNEFSGRSHWGKSGPYYHSRVNLERKVSSDALQGFSETMKTYDPMGVFLNDFGRRLLGKSDKQNWDPRVKHCALSDNCVCSKDEDCAREQKCSKIEGYPMYPVCLDKRPLKRNRPLFNYSRFTFYPKIKHWSPDIEVFQKMNLF